jgi:hypothetical protein
MGSQPDIEGRFAVALLRITGGDEDDPACREINLYFDDAKSGRARSLDRASKIALF